MGETSAKSVICAFGVAALAGRPPFARAFAGTGDCSEFANIWNSVRNFQNSFFWTVCVRAIRVWKGGPTGAAESLLSGFMIRVVKNQTSRFHFFRSPKAFVGSTQFEQEQSGGPRGTVGPHTPDAPTTRLVCALQGTWAWRGRSVVDVGRRCGRSVSVLFDPPRPRPGTRVLARVRVRGVVPPGQNRPTATLAGALSLNASSGPPSAWTFHGTHAFFRPCAGVCFVSTGGRRGYCHRSDPRGWRRDGKRVARAQSRKLAGGSTAGTVDGVGTAARFRQVAFLFDAATFPQRSEFEHGVVMVCLQG